jgi:hypothetical protein
MHQKESPGPFFLLETDTTGTFWTHFFHYVRGGQARGGAMIYTRMTRGWVAQQYDSETGDCVRQEFIAEDPNPQRVDASGEPIPDGDVEELQNTEKHFPFDMVQP